MQCRGTSPHAESVHATEGAFATLHRGGSVIASGHPFFGGEGAIVRKDLYNVQWLEANATMMFAGRSDLAVIYWGAHTGILTPLISPGGELGRPSNSDQTEEKRGSLPVSLE